MKSLYVFWGKIRAGQKRGRRLGYPTANMHLLLPIPEGIYISVTKIGKEYFNSVTFIGAARMFGEKKVKAETYILDFSRIVYGKWISIRLIKKIRANQQFTSEDALKRQMEEDVLCTREFFSK